MLENPSQVIKFLTEALSILHRYIKQENVSKLVKLKRFGKLNTPKSSLVNKRQSPYLVPKLWK